MAATSDAWAPADGDDGKALASALCFGDLFLATGQDEERARRILAGDAPFRNRYVRRAGWSDPQDLEPALVGSWKFHYHSLAWLDPLRRLHRTDPGKGYDGRFIEILAEWLERHGAPPDPLPTSRQPGDYAWYDMAAAWRTMALIGGVSMVGLDAFLQAHLMVHAEVLNRDEYYVVQGNHALHQNEALLSAALVLNREDYLRKALERLMALRAISIDEEGVTLEGAAGYHLMNQYWWSCAKRRVDLASRFAKGAWRIDLPDMRPFLRCVIAPDRRIAPIGDSHLQKGPMGQGIAAKYPADFVAHLLEDPHLRHRLTEGAEGEAPTRSMTVFKDGYWFSESVRPDRKAGLQSHVSLRFGPGLASRVHAHDDAGSATFYPRGRRVLEDGGLYSYYGGEKRGFVKSQRAHNVVLVEGRKYYQSAVSVLDWAASGADFDQAAVGVTAVERTRWSRILAHARNEDFLFVRDRVETGGAAFRQIFNLGDGFALVQAREGRVDASDGAAKVSLIWLNARTKLGTARGERDPMLGWRSTYEGEIHPVLCVFNAVAEADPEAQALVVVLLAEDEDFEDVGISQIRLDEDQARFSLRRRGRSLSCAIALKPEGEASSIARPTPRQDVFRSG